MVRLAVLLNCTVPVPLVYTPPVLLQFPAMVISWLFWLKVPPCIERLPFRSHASISCTVEAPEFIVTL
ncbi:hypothetical protein ES708_11635 [subsurface metagenome]